MRREFGQAESQAEIVNRRGACLGRVIGSRKISTNPNVVGEIVRC